jgi:hypothetical protein
MTASLDTLRNHCIDSVFLEAVRFRGCRCGTEDHSAC